MPEPSRAISRYDGPRSTTDLRDYALALAFDTDPEGRYKRNDALPVAFRGNPGAVAFAVEYAKALDVSPVTALVGMHIVDGKPTASAGLISALVRRAGHTIRTWTEGTVEEGNLRGITTIKRADDPDFEYRSTWTLERAVRAGLCTMAQDPNTGKWTVSSRGRSGKPGGWETYTENMVKARSITEASRDAAEDAILGVHYTPEELGVEVDEAGEPVYTVTQVDAEPRREPPAPRRQEETPPVSDGKVDPVALADEIRAEILAAADSDALTAVWTGRGLTRETAAALETADADGQATTIFDLFARVGAELKARPDVVDAVVVEDEQQDGNLVDLERLLDRLGQENPRALSDLGSWAIRVEADLDTRDNAIAGRILEAVSSGQAFTDTTVRETLEETPADLVARLLGGTVVEDRAPSPGEQLRADREEQRAEAAAARPAGGRPDPSAAARRAREAIAKPTTD